jgi:hypothetical protein
MALSPEKVVREFKSDSWEAHCRRGAAWSLGIGAHSRIAFPFQPWIAALDGSRREEFLKDLGIEIAAPKPNISSGDRNILELAKALDDHFA